LAWTSATLDGIVQARPLVVGSIVVVATEDDSLYGLNLANGSTVWGPVSVGTPEPVSHVRTFGLDGCGDIPVLGITSNPVLGSNGDVYAVGEVATYPPGPPPSGVDPPVHKLAAIDPSTGALTLGPTVIDPAAMTDTPAQQQRAGLLAANGNIYIGFGGLSGDCGTYHGFLVAASQSDATIEGSLEIAAADNAGAIWGTSGPVADANGNVYATTGNAFGSPSTGTDYSDGVVEVKPAYLSGGANQTAPSDYFQPPEWQTDNNFDWDLGSTGPLLLPNGTQLFVIGKQHHAFLLNTSALGGSDHMTPAGRLNWACSPGQAFGQNAVLGNAAYIACTDGMRQVLIS
jgi:hypothetical protein